MTKTEQEFHVKNHEQSAAHHESMAQNCVKKSDAHSGLAQHFEVTDRTAAMHHKNLSECYKADALGHTAEAERQQACAKAVAAMMPETADGPTDKAQASEIQTLLAGLTKLLGGAVPTAISAIPRMPVPRFGQQDPTGAVAKVAPELRHLVEDATLAHQ